MSGSSQFVRFVLVGLGSNLIGYGLYLLMTRVGVEPKLAMTLLYLLGVLQTFVFNKRWSFEFGGALKPAFVRYAICYFAGYLLNLAALFILVDQAGFNHEVVQAVLIAVVAAMMFSVQKFWVFSARDEDDLR